MKKDIMIKISPRFQKEIFQRAVIKYKGSIKASSYLDIPAVSIRGYKNLYFNSVPKILLTKLVRLNIINNLELKNNIISTFNKNTLINNNLNKGREKRKENLIKLKEQIPILKNIMWNNRINFLKWFLKYKDLASSGFRKINFQIKNKNIEASYYNFNGKSYQQFRVLLPIQIILNKEFIYFFGLWCGDRAGGKRFGICNKNRDIISFTEKFLKKYNQKIERILYISKKLRAPNIDYSKKFVLNHDVKGWVLSVHSYNGIFSPFFHYLLKNLDKFLRYTPYKEAFFAGLFDAEGNVSLYNKSFRWACQNKELIRIYLKYLKAMNLFDKYDGSCLICKNIDSFYKKIYPYLKHPTKINSTLFLVKGSGKMPKDFLEVLQYIYKNPLNTSKSIAKALKKPKVYSELRMLNNFNFISFEGYPFKYKITEKGIKPLGV